jgi:hypothetical protein
LTIRRSHLRPVVRANGLIPLEGAPGVYLQKADIILNEKLVTFLRELRKRVNFDITVNSGIRSVSRQANAMWTNAQARGGGRAGLDYLADLYGSKLVNAGLYNVKSLADLTAIVQSLANRGIYVSDHMKGNGVDIDNVSGTQLTQLKSAVASMKQDLVPYLALLNEGNHLHLDGIGESFLTKLKDLTGEVIEAGEELVIGGKSVVTRAAAAFPTWLWVLSGVSIVGTVGWIFWQKRKAKR